VAKADVQTADSTSTDTARAVHPVRCQRLQVSQSSYYGSLAW